jgi:hypothetical protein
VLAAPLALILGALPEVWAETEGLHDSAGAACGPEALASALKTQRPGLVVHTGHAQTEAPRTPGGSIRVRLTEQGGKATLEVTGVGTSIVRTISEADDCERNIATAALIVDGALDELRISEAAPNVDSLAPPVSFRKQIQVSALVGAGTEQGVFGWVPALGVAVSGRFRLYELTLGTDLGLPSSTGFSITPPEAGSGTVSTLTFGVDLAAGVAPRLGPGRLIGDGVVGLGFTFASVQATGVFQRQAQTSTEPFGGLRLGYILDLAHGFFFEVRTEERASRRGSFQVIGASFPVAGGLSTVTTPIWTFRALGFAGYHFL